MAIALNNIPVELHNQSDVDYLLQVAGSELKQVHGGLTSKGLDLTKISDQEYYLPRIISHLQRVVDYHKNNKVGRE